MKLVTKFCKHCGKIMRDVTPQKRVCDTCLAHKRRADDNARYRQKKGVKKEQKCKAALPALKSVKSIEQCVREAAALGISYGQYVQRGLDKE